MIHGVELITNANDMVATDLVTDSSTFTFVKDMVVITRQVFKEKKKKKKNTLQYPSVQWSLQLLSL